jgi:hypothetical protein
MADVNLGQTAAATLRNRSSEIADSVTNNNALLAWMKAKGKIKTKTGGRTFVEPIFHSENGTSKFYDGAMESFSIAPESVIDASEWDRKFQAGFVYFTEAERQSNRGEAQAIDLIEAKLENLKSTLANDFSTAMYADGTTAKQIQGLQALIADDPTTGTVGGIDAGTYTFWRNQYKTDTTASASNIDTLLQGVWLSTIRGTDKPDLIVAGSDMFTYLVDYYAANQRFMSWDKADMIDFEGIRFQSATVLFDPNCYTKRMYGIQTKDLTLCCDPGRKWSPGSNREIQNATYEVVPVLWSGALTTKRRESHFVIEGT